eukprot:ANDGO_06897.mRNA.1 C-5 sterol desaturase
MMLMLEMKEAELETVWGPIFPQPTWTWALMIMTSLSLFSMVLSIWAQWFSYFWEPITTDGAVLQRNNRPTHAAVLSWAGNHSCSGILTYFAWTYACTHDMFYEMDVTSMGVQQLGVYVLIVFGHALSQLMMYDLQVYIIHKVSHKSRLLYRLVHAWHHENSLPCGFLDGIYGDAFEGSLISVFALWPMCVFRFTSSGTALYVMYIAITVQLNHSGRKVEIPWLFYTARMHFYHHQRRIVNYAEHLPIWDWLFGTLYLPTDYEIVGASTANKVRSRIYESSGAAVIDPQANITILAAAKTTGSQPMAQAAS